MTLYPTVKVGAAEVYLSGTVICRTGQAVEITPVPSALSPYRLQLLFVEHPFLGSKVEVTNQPNNLVLVTFTNFGSDPASTMAPLTVGQVAGVPLLLDIAGSSTGSGGSLVRVITFTVLMGSP